VKRGQRACGRQQSANSHRDVEGSSDETSSRLRVARDEREKHIKKEKKLKKKTKKNKKGESEREREEGRKRHKLIGGGRIDIRTCSNGLTQMATFLKNIVEDHIVAHRENEKATVGTR